MRRRPVHFALVVLAYLAAGAVVTVVVAWGIAAWLPMPKPGRHEVLGSLPSFIDMVPEEWPPHVRTVRARAFGHSDTQASFEVAGVTWPNERYLIRYVRLGWPFPAMKNWFLIEVPGGRPGQTVWDNGTRIPPWLPRFMRYNRPYVGNLPLRPDMPGFVVNSVFYGAVLFATAWGAGRVRRAWRVRRGLCPKCAYPVGVAERCTECGEPLRGKRKAANEQSNQFGKRFEAIGREGAA